MKVKEVKIPDKSAVTLELGIRILPLALPTTERHKTTTLNT
jgi:hypothetical protein